MATEYELRTELAAIAGRKADIAAAIHACSRCGMEVPDARGLMPCWHRDCPEPVNTEWQVAAQAYLQRLGAAEYAAAMAAHLKARRSRRTYRHNPSKYHRELCRLLGQNDEEGFKSLKMLQGYASKVGV